MARRRKSDMAQGASAGHEARVGSENASMTLPAVQVKMASCLHGPAQCLVPCNSAALCRHTHVVAGPMGCGASNPAAREEGGQAGLRMRGQIRLWDARDDMLLRSLSRPRGAVMVTWGKKLCIRNAGHSDDVCRREPSHSMFPGCSLQIALSHTVPDRG